MRQDDAPKPVTAPGSSLDRRAALRAAAALAVAAVPVAGCEPGGHRAGATASGQTAAGQTATRGSRADGAAASTRTPAPTATPLPPEVINGPRDRPNVALTFHGQGDPAQVLALLGALEQGGARVTVLAVGSWLAAQPQLARRILDGGHELGNHTQNHEDISSMSPADAFDEISACAAVLRRLVGSIGTWFRPSMTQYSTATIRAEATRVGYPTCLSYDLDSLDNTDPGASAVARTVAGSVRPGSIVSMHCGHSGTVTAIPAILGRLQALGLRAVTMTELVSP